MKKAIILSVFLLGIMTPKIWSQLPSIDAFIMDDEACQNDILNFEVKIHNFSTLTNGVNDLQFSFNNYLQVEYSPTFTPSTFNITSVTGDTTVLGGGDIVTFSLSANEDWQSLPPIDQNFNVTFQVTFLGYGTDSYNDSAQFNSLPTVNEVGAPLVMCETDQIYDLYNKVDVLGGSFYAFGSNGNENVESIIGERYFDPSVFVPGMLPEMMDYVYEDLNGCTSTISIDYPIVDESPSVMVSTTDASCGQSDGGAVATATGGTSPYIFEWSNNTTGATLNNSPSGVYQVYVSDINGCTREANAAIGNNDISVTSNITQPTCWDDTGDAILNITTSGNHTTWWSTGVYGDGVNDLPIGTHYATITTDSGCEEVVEVTIVPESEEITIGDTYIFEESCNSGTGSVDGVIELSQFGGGTLPLNFSWSNGVTDSINSNISAGQYSVTISDANGCQISENFTLGSYSSASYFISLENVVPSDCGANNGGADIYLDDWNSEISTYSWSNGQTTTDLINVAPGDYTLTYSDIYGCSNIIEVTVPTKAPLVNPICLISVDTTTTSNLIVWEREETTGIQGYNIYREDGEGQYNLVGYNPASEESVFNDVNASPKVKSWRYRISAVNDCGVEGPMSLPHRTSHLKRTQNGNDFTLNWNLYEGFDYSTNGIKIYRYTDAQGQWVLASTELSTTKTFTETVNDNTGIDYAIDFEPDNGACTSTRAQSHNSSRSNRTEGIFNPGEGTGDTNNELAELDLVNNTTIYPNPSKGVFNIELEGFENHTVDFKVYNVEGKVIENGAIKNSFHTMDLSNFDGGIYIIHLNTEFHNVVKRIILK